MSEIKGTDGYTDETPVVYINEFNKEDKSCVNEMMFDNIAISPYDNSNLGINSYNWQIQMYIYTGFPPIDPYTGFQVSGQTEDDYKYRPEVVEMPCYPDCGSIQIIDGALIVKFADNQ